MNKNKKPQLQQPSLLEQLFPTETGLTQSLAQSKTLIIILVIFFILFGGLGLFLFNRTS